MNRRIVFIIVIAAAAIISISAVVLMNNGNDGNDIKYEIDKDDVKIASEETSDRYISPFTKKSETSRKNAELFLSKAVADDDHDKDGESSLKNCLDALKKRSDGDLPNYVLRFIQNDFEYTSDSELYNEREWAAFPIETLDKKAGDCEDLAILMIALMYRAGYDCGITVFSSTTIDGKKLPSHAVAMIAADCIQESDHEDYSLFCREYDGKKYYAFETTDECQSGYTFKEYVDMGNSMQSSYTFMTISEYLDSVRNG